METETETEAVVGAETETPEKTAGPTDPYDREACVGALREAADLLGHSPTMTEYQNLGMIPSVATITMRFGSWNEAKEAAGLEQYDRGGRPSQTDASAGTDAPAGPDVHQIFELTGFQRDLLTVIAQVGPASGQEIKDELEGVSDDEINNGRLYPNLDRLITKGLVDSSERDRRTNDYHLTDDGRSALRGYLSWVAAGRSSVAVGGD
ncbi:helix-turn-helix transcriptional regulator [Halegenticoccus tardaugens]|uniref:helix-turn-helix transcriptional regulator n=1 Tax=Halegenticoccus tardaugens TaxID=2071624 RepID=UPI003742EA65